jgi:hypothetical protein
MNHEVRPCGLASQDRAGFVVDEMARRPAVLIKTGNGTAHWTEEHMHARVARQAGCIRQARH